MADRNGTAPPQEVFDMTIHGKLEAQRVRIETLVDEVERLRNASLRPVQLIAPASSLMAVSLAIVLAVGSMYSSSVNERLKTLQDTLASTQAEVKAIQGETLGAFSVNDIVSDLKEQLGDLRTRLREVSDNLVLEAIESRRGEQRQSSTPPPVVVSPPVTTAPTNNVPSNGQQ